MPNFQDILRFASLFTNPESPAMNAAGNTNTQMTPSFEPQQPQYQSAPDPTFKPYQAPATQRPFEPEYNTPALDAYMQTVASPPQFQNASKMRMLGTGLLSALQRTPDEVQETTNAKGEMSRIVRKGHWDPFDVEEAGKILNIPNAVHEHDYDVRAKGLSEAARIEGTNLNNQSLRDSRYNNMGVANAREGRLTDQGNRKIDIAGGQLEVSMAKQRLDRWKAENPTGVIKESKGGNFYVIDPRTGESIDTGVDGGSATDQERIRWTGEERLKQIGAQGLNQQAAIQETAGYASQHIAEQGAQNRLTKQTPSADAGVTGLLPTQKKQALILKANQLVQLNPSWREWIVEGDDGLPQLTPPGQTIFGRQTGPTLAEYTKMYKAMYGDPTPEEQLNPPVTAPNGPRVTAPTMDKPQAPIYQKNKKTNQVRVSTDGGKTWKIQ